MTEECLKRNVPEVLFFNLNCNSNGAQLAKNISSLFDYGLRTKRGTKMHYSARVKSVYMWGNKTLGYGCGFCKLERIFPGRTSGSGSPETQTCAMDPSLQP
jgi:hypothetical protein